MLGRHAHEENIHADSLLYMISSLGIDPHECEAMFDGIPTIVAKNRFVTDVSHALRRDLDMDDPDARRLLARNIFVFGQCMEGTQFYGLFGMILSLYRQGKLPGIGTMFRYTLRDESNHIELFRRLLRELAAENPELWTPAFREELRELMREAVALEQALHRRLPAGRGRRPLARATSRQYIDYIADRRLVGVGLEPLHGGAGEPAAVAGRADGRPQASRTSSRAGSPSTRRPSALAARRRRGALAMLDFAEILQDLELKRAAALPTPSAQRRRPPLAARARVADDGDAADRAAVADAVADALRRSRRARRARPTRPPRVRSWREHRRRRGRLRGAR